LRPHRIVLQKLGEPAAVFVRPAVDDGELVGRRGARPDRLAFAISDLACGRAGAARRVGNPERRAVDDAEDRDPVLDQGDENGEFAAPGDEFLGPVERVDGPEAGSRGRQAFGLDQFLGSDRDVGEGLRSTSRR
jgi:hypothetical protein